jgi:outer membrane protein assembly factor BamB
MFHGDIARTGRSPAPAIVNPIIRWKAKVGIQGWLNSPVVRGNLVLVPSSGKRHNRGDAADGVYAIDLNTGEQKWHRRFSRDANSVAFTAVHALATSDDGNLYALDLDTGKVLWKKRGKGKMYTHPLVVGWRAFVGDATGMLRAFRATDGVPQWEIQLQGAIRGGAASDGEHVYAISEAGEGVAAKLDGSVVWKGILERPTFTGSSTTPIISYSPPIVHGQHLIVPFVRNTTYDWPAIAALELESGQIAWQAKGEGSWGNIRSTPALVGDQLLYGETYSGDVAAVGVTDGATKYRYRVGHCYFPQWASPAAAQQTFYMPRFDGNLYALRANDGAMLWQAYLGEANAAGVSAPVRAPEGGCSWERDKGSPLTSPVAIAADGAVLVGSEEGYLFAITDASRP